MINENNESVMYHQTHLVTFSTVSNHSYDFNYSPNNSNERGIHIREINWGEENINADEAFEDSIIPSNDNTIEYEEGKWVELELEGCAMELLGNKVNPSDTKETKPIRTRKKKKKKIRIVVKKPFDFTQLKICSFGTEIINSNDNNTQLEDKDIGYYQEQFEEYLSKNGLDNMKGLDQEEKTKKMEIARLAFLEFSRLKQEEITRLVEVELEKRIKEKTVEGLISEEEEQKIWDDLSHQYNALIPQAPPYINIPKLLDLHKKKEQRNYRITKGSSIEVIDDPTKSNLRPLSDSQSSISNGNSLSDNSEINQLNENLSKNADEKRKKKGHHHHHHHNKRQLKELEAEEKKQNILDNKTIVIEKLKRLNESEMQYTHTEIKKAKPNSKDKEYEEIIHHCRTFTKKNNACCPYCRKDKSNLSSTNGNGHIHNKIMNKDNAHKVNDEVNELKKDLGDNDNEEEEDDGDDDINENEDNNYNHIDIDSNDEESDNNDNDNVEQKNNDDIYDSNEEESIRESDKDSETKRKEARIKAKEKEKEKAKLKAKKKPMTKPNIFNPIKKPETTKKPEIKPQLKKEQPKQQQQQLLPQKKPQQQQQDPNKKEAVLPNYSQYTNKREVINNNNNITNQPKTKKVMQSLHKPTNITTNNDNKSKLSPNMSQNQSISTRGVKNPNEKVTGQSNKINPSLMTKVINNDPNNSNNKNANQPSIHLRNLSQQAIKPMPKKQNNTHQESNTISKPSHSLTPNDSNLTNLPLAITNRTQRDGKKVTKPQSSAASTIAPISGTNFYNTKKIEYITNKDLNFGFEFWKENQKNPCFSTKNSRCHSGQQSNVIEEEEKKRLKPIKRKTFSNLTKEELEKKKKQISELMKDKSNPYSLYWPDKFMNNAYQMGMTSYKSINGVPIITLVKRKEETIEETFNQIQQELHKQKQLEMSKFHNKSSLSFHPCLDKANGELEQDKSGRSKMIQYPHILKYFN